MAIGHRQSVHEERHKRLGPFAPRQPNLVSQGATLPPDLHDERKSLNTMRNSESLLTHRLERVFDDGSRRIVPIIGSGLHRHLGAHGVPELDLCGANGLANWADLLMSASLDKKGRPEFLVPRLECDDDPTAVWESMLAERAKVVDQPASHHEQVLRTRVAALVREATPSSQVLVAFGQALASRGFRDIVSLNFDRTLDRAMRGASVDSMVYGRKPAEQTGNAGDAASMRPRLWHPHGMVAEPDEESTSGEPEFTARELQLGLRNYSTSSSDLLVDVHAFRVRKRNWKERQRNTKRFHEHVREQPESWVDVLLNSDIVFIGCGLSRVELDLWLLLHERQRELVRLPEADRPQGFFLHPLEGFPRKLRKSYAGLVPVITRSHDECWELLLGKWWA